MSKAREDYITWDEYFMALAVLSGHRSKDPNRQVGACIVNEDNKIMGIGYNGFPKGCSDDTFPWGKGEKGKAGLEMGREMLDTKYPFVVHAEVNAISNCHSRELKNCVMYVAMFPCNECTKLIIQSGIKKILYLSDRNHNHPSWVASRRMLDAAKVRYESYDTTRSQPIGISLSSDLNQPSLPPHIPSTTAGSRVEVFIAGVVIGALCHVVWGKIKERW